MTRTVVITGIGLITPAGDREQAWAHAREGATAVRPIDRFDAGPYGVADAGVVDDQALERFPARHRKRMDRFSTLGLLAAGDALSDAGVDLDAVDRDRVGVSIGNMHGGWAITEPSLRKLLQGHEAEVSPYVASAWFPTAPQGQISIEWQLKGHSKTYASDTASGAHALGYAADAIAHGRADMVLAGGATAPITDYTYAFCARSGRLAPEGYRPFDERAEGFQIGEGAAILLLEEEGAARARGAHVYGRLAGWATRHAARRNGDAWADGGAFGDVIGEALAAADVAPGELDYVALDAQGTPAADRAEAAALTAALRRFPAAVHDHQAGADAPAGRGTGDRGRDHAARAARRRGSADRRLRAARRKRRPEPGHRARRARTVAHRAAERPRGGRRAQRARPHRLRSQRRSACPRTTRRSSSSARR